MLVFMAMTGVVCANAQTQYWNLDGDPVTSVTPETNYVLKNAYVASNDAYIDGGSISTTITTDNIYQFEEVGTDADGYVTYRLKHVSTGEYLQDPEASNGIVTTTALTSRAYLFTVKEAVTHDSEDDDYMETVDYTSYVYSTSVEGSVVLCNAHYKTSSYKWFCSTTTGVPSWGQATARTAWVIYNVSEASAYDGLYQVIQALFSGNSPADVFTVGTDPGQISQELFDAVEAAYTEAQATIENTELSDEEYLAAAAKLEEAYAAANAGVVKLGDGYYVITNAASDRGDGNAVIYDTGSALNWKTFALTDSTTFTASDADAIWQLISTGEDDDSYYLKNFSTGRYMGSQSSNHSAVPSTTDASQVYYVQVQSGAAFNIYTTNQNTTYPALHAQSDGVLVVIWTNEATASGWYFTAVPDDVISSLIGDLNQDQINTNVQTLIDEAKSTMNSGVTLISEATKDGYYETDGLVTDATCFFTNAQEPTEGSLAYLIDNDQTTYFHSTWSTDASSDRTHYVGADLGKEVQYVDIKYSRRNANSAGTPLTVRIYASNDTLDAANWVEQGVYTFTYTYASSTYSSELDEFTGITGVALDAPYRFIRLDVEHTMSDATTNSNLYFVFSELRFYEGEYDAANSLIEAVPDELVTALNNQIASAKADLAAGTATQTTYDDLEAVYNTFLENFPDVASVQALYEEAVGQLAAAEEGTELGYFAVGSKATLEAAINAVAPNIKDVMTTTEITSATEALQSALAAFTAALVVPSDGDILRIRSVSTSEQDGAPNGNFIYAQNSDESQIMWGGYDSETGVDEYLETRLNYLWKVIANGDGTFTLQNLATGTYMGNPKENNVDVYMSLEPDSVTFQSAKLPGYFNIVFTDGVYANMQPASNELVSWNTASGADNSAMEFRVVTDWEGTYHYDLTQKTQVITLPIDLTGFPVNGELYKVLGRTETTLELQPYDENEEIPAGTPFIYIPYEGVEEACTDFYPVAQSLDEIEYDQTPKSQNGLHGVFTSQTIGAGNGIIFYGVVTVSTASDVVAANSGYFTDDIPTTTESGAASLPIDGVITAIENVKVLPTSSVDVYTLSGVKVRQGAKAATAVSGLPKGIYIVGGQKVLVK